MAGADFVKTSTGYGSAGCTIEDLKLMRANVSEAVRIKGSGGIRDRFRTRYHVQERRSREVLSSLPCLEMQIVE